MRLSNFEELIKYQRLGLADGFFHRHHPNDLVGNPPLIVVVVGGLGSIWGAMVVGMALGLLQVMGNVWLPSVAGIVRVTPHLAD